MANCVAVCGNGKPCSNKAYYEVDGRLYCGVHSRGKERRTLPKVKVDREKEFQEHALTLQPTDQPKVVLFRMGMMASVPLQPGYLNVFPNNKHQNRRDGFGCAALSPMRLGPVVHGQPGLPIAVTLEAFWQSSKKYPCETWEEFRATRYEWYFSPPEKTRRKFTSKDIPEYFVWLDRDGTEKHVSYIDSRQFYCNFYERLAMWTTEFAELKTKLAQGINLCICGYDAFPIDDVEKAYLDPSRPFGHERVLLTMLTADKKEWPWRKYKTYEF
jgi:hypothetical protein